MFYLNDKITFIFWQIYIILWFIVTGWGQVITYNELSNFQANVLFSSYSCYYRTILTHTLLFVAIFIHSKISSDQDDWIPDLRGLPNIDRQGEVIAEFSVASAPAPSSQEEDVDKKEGDQIVRPNKEYNICTDPVKNVN